MGELRSGYAANILSEIMGLDVPAEAGSAFWTARLVVAWRPMS